MIPVMRPFVAGGMGLRKLMTPGILGTPGILVSLGILVTTGAFVALTAIGTVADEPQGADDFEPVVAASSVAEARTRARMMHEMVRGTLQVMHRDFFDEENAHAIPSASLEDVFHEMEIEYDVKMKWLIVDTDVLNVDHKAEGEFEKRAVKTLAKGKTFVEETETQTDIPTGPRSGQETGDAVYRFAGAIPLGTQCLKCHVKRRTTNEDRTAGLVITMPISSAAVSGWSEKIPPE